MRRRKRWLIPVCVLMFAGGCWGWKATQSPLTRLEVSQKLAIGMTPDQVETALGWAQGTLELEPLTTKPDSYYATLLDMSFLEVLILPGEQIYLDFDAEKQLKSAEWVVLDGLDELDRKEIKLGRRTEP